MWTTRFAGIFSFFLLLLAISCSSSSDNTEPPINDKLVMSALSRDTAPDVSETDLTAVVGGNTEFALNAFPLLEEDPDKNTVFSPYSITLAVALAAVGANGPTLSEIETAMSFTLRQDSLNPAFNKLDLLLASKTTGTIHEEDGSRSPQLNIVNAVWAQDGYPILSEYLDLIAVNYGAGLHLVDYIKAAEEARKTINAWVDRQTNSRIPELMEQGSVSNMTRVVLTNAIWFKGNWSSKFPENGTTTRTFYNRGTTPALVSFMSQTFNVRAVQKAAYQAVDIPYVDGNLSMLVVMPADFDAFLAALTPADLDSIVGQLTDQYVALAMPKFSFTTALGLKAVLASLGMTAAFNPTQADFSGITGNFDLSIQSVVHKAFINVDENGTEAAAATGISMGTTGLPSSPIIVNVDQPFIFMIRDRQTGLILFMGKVVTL